MAANERKRLLQRTRLFRNLASGFRCLRAFDRLHCNPSNVVRLLGSFLMQVKDLCMASTVEKRRVMSRPYPTYFTALQIDDEVNEGDEHAWAHVRCEEAIDELNRSCG